MEWSAHGECLCARLTLRLYFFHSLRLFGLGDRDHVNILQCCAGKYHQIWCDTLTIKLMMNTAMKRKKEFLSLHAIYERRANRILKNRSHVQYSEYKLLPSGRRYSKFKINRLKVSRLTNIYTRQQESRLNHNHKFSM